MCVLTSFSPFAGIRISIPKLKFGDSVVMQKITTRTTTASEKLSQHDSFSISISHRTQGCSSSFLANPDRSDSQTRRHTHMCVTEKESWKRKQSSSQSSLAFTGIQERDRERRVAGIIMRSTLYFDCCCCLSMREKMENGRKRIMPLLACISMLSATLLMLRTAYISHSFINFASFIHE